MRNQRLLTLLSTFLAFGLVTASCTDDGDDGGDAIDLSDRIDDNDFADEQICIYSPEFLLVDVGQAERADDPLAAVGIERTTVLDVLKLEEQLPGDAVDLAERIEAQVAVYTVPDNLDALQAAIALSEHDIDAEPLLAFGYTGHWVVAPDGASPMTLVEPVGASPLDERDLQPAEEETPVEIAVLDTGFSPTTIDFIDHYVTTPDPAFDADSGNHGTFIASLIRQVNPKAGVVAVRIGEGTHRFRNLDHGGDPLGDHIDTNESLPHTLSLLVATARAAQAISAKEPLLNISGGVYPCATLEPEKHLVGVRAAVDYWNSQFDSDLVIAAAGNDQDAFGEFYPAAFGDVTSVASSGHCSTFSNSGNVTIPGENVLGFAHGGTKPGWYSWSGTSFATPIYAAALSAETGTQGEYENEASDPAAWAKQVYEGPGRWAAIAADQKTAGVIWAEC